MKHNHSIKIALIASALTSPLFLSGCSNGSSNNSGNNNGNLNTPLSLTSATATTIPGQPAVFNLNLQSPRAIALPVALSVSGLPINATSSFSPNQIALTSGSFTGSSTLTVIPGANTPPGTYNLLINGATGGLSFGTAQATLIVRAAGSQENFSLTVSPSSTFVSQTLPATFVVTISAPSGISQPVNLSVSGGGAGYNLSGIMPNSLNLSGQTTATATFMVSLVAGATAISPTTFTVTATSGGSTQSASVSVQPQ